MSSNVRHERSLTDRQFIDLVQRADAYILALRKTLSLYAGNGEVELRSQAHLNEAGSCWYAARENYAWDVPEGK